MDAHSGYRPWVAVLDFRLCSACAGRKKVKVTFKVESAYRSTCYTHYCIGTLCDPCREPALVQPDCLRMYT